MLRDCETRRNSRGAPQKEKRPKRIRIFRGSHRYTAEGFKPLRSTPPSGSVPPAHGPPRLFQNFAAASPLLPTRPLRPLRTMTSHGTRERTPQHLCLSAHFSGFLRTLQTVSQIGRIFLKISQLFAQLFAKNFWAFSRQGISIFSALLNVLP